MYSAFLANAGTIRAAWLSAYLGGRGIMTAGNQLQEWYSPDDRVVVGERKFTPNRISFTLRTGQGGKLVISQGYDPGWRRVDGGRVSSFSDLVCAEVPPGSTGVELYYRPDYFWSGAVVSLVSILGALVLAARVWRSGQKAEA
jgi:uncharacterized membrane protein YfhO